MKKDSKHLQEKLKQQEEKYAEQFKQLHNLEIFVRSTEEYKQKMIQAEQYISP